MNNTAKFFGATALGLGIAVGIPVLGQAVGQGNGYGYGMGMMHGGYGGGFGAGHMMGYGGMGYGGMPYGQMHFGGNFESHLGDIKTALQLTTDQQPVWDQFEQAVKTMTANGPWNTGMSGDPDTHLAQMQAHFTLMKAVFDAHKTLYNALTDQQKETLTNYMPGPFGQQ